MPGKPKYKGEIREQIIKNVNQNKNVYSLRELLSISEIMAKQHDEKLYKTLSEREYDTGILINFALSLSDESFKRLFGIARNISMNDIKKRKKVKHE